PVLAPERLKQRHFLRRRWSDGHQIGILKWRMSTDISAIHDGLVGPLEIERIAERFAHARILEFVAPGVEEPALRARWRIVRKQFALDAAVHQRRKIVARVPYPRGELLAKQVIAAGEAFEGDIAVAVEIEPQSIEIVAASIDGKISAPPIPDALKLDETIDLEFRHFVGPGSQRNIERRFIERMGRVIGLRKEPE